MYIYNIHTQIHVSKYVCVLKYFKALKRKKIITCLKWQRKGQHVRHIRPLLKTFSPEALTQQKKNHCVWVEMSWAFGKNEESCRDHSKLRHSYSLSSGGGWGVSGHQSLREEGAEAGFRECVGIMETSFQEAVVEY